MQLKTKRLNIRFINESDWKELIEIWNDFSHSEFAKYDVPHLETEVEAQEKAKQWADVSPGKEHMFFAVCLGDKLIGYIDFHKNTEEYECGYCFHSGYHGNGYAKESLKALMEWLSGNRRTCFTARTALNNISSVKLLETLGFSKVGEEKVTFYKNENGKDIYFTGGIFALETK